MSPKNFSSTLQTLQTFLRPRLRVWRWVVPLLLVTFVVIYELWPARWLYEQYGLFYHTLADVLIFGTIGPLLAFTVLYFLERWLDERDTSDLQSRVLNRVRAEVQNGRQLNDDALQVLFAVSLLMDSFKEDYSEQPSQTAVQIEKTEEALQQAIQQLRTHLVNTN